MTILRFAGMVRLAPHTPVLSGSLDVLGSRPVLAAKELAVARQPGAGLPRPSEVRRGGALLQAVTGDRGEGPGTGAPRRGHEPQSGFDPNRK